MFAARRFLSSSPRLPLPPVSTLKHTGCLTIGGNIGVGKSTFLQNVAGPQSGVLSPPPTIHKEALSDVLCTAFYKDPKKYALTFQLHMLEQRLRQSEVGASVPRGEGLVLDRSVVDDAVFGVLNSLNGSIDAEGFSIYADRVRCSSFKEAAARTESYMYLHAPPGVCAGRIRERARDAESEMDQGYLEDLDMAHWYMVLSLLEHSNTRVGVALSCEDDSKSFATAAHPMLSDIISPRSTPVLTHPPRHTVSFPGREGTVVRGGAPKDLKSLPPPPEALLFGSQAAKLRVNSSSEAGEYSEAVGGAMGGRPLEFALLPGDIPSSEQQPASWQTAARALRNRTARVLRTHKEVEEAKSKNLAVQDIISPPSSSTRTSNDSSLSAEVLEAGTGGRVQKYWELSDSVDADFAVAGTPLHRPLVHMPWDEHLTKRRSPLPGFPEELAVHSPAFRGMVWALLSRGYRISFFSSTGPTGGAGEGTQEPPHVPSLAAALLPFTPPTSSPSSAAPVSAVGPSGPARVFTLQDVFSSLMFNAGPKFEQELVPEPFK